jgi:ribosomal protein S18 acetylase RimI-like enzyme
MSMDIRLIELSCLTDTDLKSLAVLHHSVMHTLLSDLGLPMILRYYQIAQADPQVIGLCAISPAGDVLGWAMGSPHPDRINAGLRSPFAWFVLQMVRVALIRPRVLWQLISSVSSAPSGSELKMNDIELTYIGVSSVQRGKGLGKKLLNAFIEASRSHGYHSVMLSVETENSLAISLYEKEGFKVIRTFSEGRYQRHRMELTLA